MTEIGRLRRRMLEDVTARYLPLATQRAYVSAGTKFSPRFRRSPDRLGAEEFAPSSCN